jgi:hypothetical protein
MERHSPESDGTTVEFRGKDATLAHMTDDPSMDDAGTTQTLTGLGQFGRN